MPWPKTLNPTFAPCPTVPGGPAPRHKLRSHSALSHKLLSLPGHSALSHKLLSLPVIPLSRTNCSGAWGTHPPTPCPPSPVPLSHKLFRARGTHPPPLARFIRRGDTTTAEGGPSKTMQLGRTGWAGCGPVGKDEHTRDGLTTILGPRRPGGSGGGHTVHGRCGMRWGVGELPSGPHIWVWLLLPSGSLSHTRTGSISTVEVGWFIHRFQPP